MSASEDHQNPNQSKLWTVKEITVDEGIESMEFTNTIFLIYKSGYKVIYLPFPINDNDPKISIIFVNNIRDSRVVLTTTPGNDIRSCEDVVIEDLVLQPGETVKLSNSGKTWYTF